MPFSLFMILLGLICFFQSTLPKTISEINKQSEHVRKKRQFVAPPSGSGSQRVRQPCRFNTDCISGAYCASSVCVCLSTHVDLNSYCWTKINPEESGCTYNEQCSAVWPGATCESSICRCPFNRPPTVTRDGPVCHLPETCPTNSHWPKLKQPGSTVNEECILLSLSGGRTDYLGCGTQIPVYDCIGASAVNSAPGYCCPNRALACIQPLDGGYSATGGAADNRFFYNSITQSCQQFRYLGAGGNANNFVSHDQCVSYCRQACPRANPQYSSNDLNCVSCKPRYCTTSSSTSTNTCGNSNFQCQQSGSTQLCCPKVAFICGPYGGIPLSSAPTGAGYDGGVGAAGQAAAVRWYYDATNKRCQTFNYLGQGGNFNNFQSRDDCDAFCSQALCEKGEPLKDTSGNTAMICTGNSGCPATHECKNSVCCPSKYTVCNQPKVTGGTCNNYATRYWYNVQTGSCEQFLYTGCRGNANNFETFLDCQGYCTQVLGEPQCKQGTAMKDANGNFVRCSGSGSTTCPANYECFYDGKVYGCCPTQEYTCSLSYGSGSPCGPSSSTRWYFDTNTRSCTTFVYFGCDGNSNNFATQRDCIDYCRAGGCPDFGTPLKDGAGQITFCGTNSGVSCPSTHACVTVSATTLGSQVSNLPVAQGQFISYCCPKKSTICSNPEDPGSLCGQPLSRYFYSTRNRRCESFQYLGCSGNANNFPDLTTCTSYCESSACSAGEEIYKEPTTNVVRQCNQQIRGSCPTGYNCVFDNLAQRYVCCGASDLGVCPTGQRAYIDSLSRGARQCTPNVLGSCPSEFQCLYNINNRLYYCCKDANPNPITQTAVCGSLASPYLVGGQALQCAAAGAPGGCPISYTCQASALDSSPTRPYYCCLGSTPATSASGCPSGYQLATNMYGQPQYCSPSVSSCLSSATCQYIYTTGRYQCCSRIGQSPSQPLLPNQSAIACSNGMRPYSDATGMRRCTPGVANSCGLPDYNCQAAHNSPQFVCCPVASNYGFPSCTNGQQPYQPNGQSMTCFYGVTNSCPSRYQCERSTVNSILGQCCPQSMLTNICPNNRTPYFVLNTQPQTCSPFSSGVCPYGYECVASPGTGIYYCCSRIFWQRHEQRSNHTK